jgi:hypothetical protein
MPKTGRRFHQRRPQQEVEKKVELEHLSLISATVEWLFMLKVYPPLRFAPTL